MGNSGFLVPGKIGPVAFGAAASSDWWTVAGQTCVAAYQPKGAASLAASYVNLANPGTYNAAPGVAPTLAASGWVFAAAAYLTTGVTVGGVGWSMIVRFSNAESANSYMIGVRVISTQFAIAPNYTDGKAYYSNGTEIGVAGGAAASGIMAVSGSRAYLNGAEVSSSINNSTYAAGEIHIGRYNYSIPRPLNCTIAAIAIYSTTLSAADVAALTARMQAL